MAKLPIMGSEWELAVIHGKGRGGNPRSFLDSGVIQKVAGRDGAWLPVHGATTGFFLPDGGNIGDDHRRIEIRSRECAGPFDLIAAERQMETYARRLETALREKDPDFQVLLSSGMNYHVSISPANAERGGGQPMVFHSLLALLVSLFGPGGFDRRSLLRLVPDPRALERLDVPFSFRETHTRSRSLLPGRLHVMLAAFPRSENARLCLFCCVAAAQQLLKKGVSFPGELILSSPLPEVENLARVPAGVVDTLRGAVLAPACLRSWLDFFDIHTRKLPAEYSPVFSLADALLTDLEEADATGEIGWLLKRQACDTFLAGREAPGSPFSTLAGIEAYAERIEPHLNAVWSGLSHSSETTDPVLAFLRERLFDELFGEIRTPFPYWTGEQSRGKLSHNGLDQEEVARFFDLRLELFKMITVDWDCIGGIHDQLRTEAAIECQSALAGLCPAGILPRSRFRAMAIRELYHKYGGGAATPVCPGTASASWDGVADWAASRVIVLDKASYAEGAPLPAWQPTGHWREGREHGSL